MWVGLDISVHVYNSAFRRILYGQYLKRASTNTWLRVCEQDTLYVHRAVAALATQTHTNYLPSQSIHTDRVNRNCENLPVAEPLLGVERESVTGFSSGVPRPTKHTSTDLPFSGTV